jgi:hypothetical protein
LSIKDNINEIKKEFTTDEQMLLSAFKLEKFYKRHKIKIISAIAIIILVVGGNKIVQIIEENRLNSANEAYLTLLKDSNNSEALGILRDKNPLLFELYSYKMAVQNRDIKILERLTSSKNGLIADISNYHLSVLEKKSVSSDIYQDMAIMNNANLLIKQGKISEAKNQLALIDENSPLFNISKILKHYTIKGK